jgi:hypothetical protein
MPAPMKPMRVLITYAQGSAAVTEFRYLTAELTRRIPAWKGPPPSWSGDDPRLPARLRREREERS